MITTVMAHASFAPARVDLLPRIEKSWGDYLHHIVVDDVRQGAWPTVRSCWQKALELSDGKGHVLAAQDDFEVVPGGAELMNQLSDKFPDRIMTFRWATASCSWLWHQAVDWNTAWAKCNHSWTGGAVVLPVKLAEEFLDWAEEFDEAGGRRYNHMDDTRLDFWTLRTKNVVWRSRWGLLHHLGDDYSVVRGGGRNPSPEMGRVASADEVPKVDDPRWDITDVPEYDEWPEAFRLNASTMLKGRHRDLGL